MILIAGKLKRDNLEEFYNCFDTEKSFFTKEEVKTYVEENFISDNKKDGCFEMQYHADYYDDIDLNVILFDFCDKNNLFFVQKEISVDYGDILTGKSPDFENTVYLQCSPDGQESIGYAELKNHLKQGRSLAEILNVYADVFEDIYNKKFEIV